MSTFKCKIILLLIQCWMLHEIVNAQKLCDTAICQCFHNSEQQFVIDCARIKLTKLPDNKQMPNGFNKLDLSHNQIEQLTFDDSDFESKTLTHLKVAHNRVTKISDEFLKNIPNIRVLDLSHNRLQRLDNDLFKNVANLKRLDLSYNLLVQLPVNIFKPLIRLNHIDLSYNAIGALFTANKTLANCNLGLNETLKSLHLNAINLTQNYLPKNYFNGYAFRDVALSDNYLKEIPDLPKTIEFLDVSGNLMEKLDVKQLNYDKLKVLHLNRLKRLAHIESYAFYNLYALEEVRIEACTKLTSFNDLAFGKLVVDEYWTLKKLSLANNNLKTLNKTYFYLFNIVGEVDLSFNPWHCDCNIAWFDLLRFKMIQQDNIRCASPISMRYKQIMRLDMDASLPKCVIGSGWKNHKLLTSVICLLIVILLCLIAYLIYLRPYGRNSHFVGTQSPYNNLVLNNNDHGQVPTTSDIA